MTRTYITGPNWDKAWGEMLGILQDFANAERMGYQVIALETTDNHHENVVAEVLPAGVESYDPDSGRYSDGKEG